jgi:putative heme-binding domain-containing protein
MQSNKRSIRVALSAGLTCLVALALLTGRGLEPAAQATARAQHDKLKDAQFISEGAKLFAPTCGNAYCHGTGGAGGGAPRIRGRGLDAAYLFKTISNGIPGTAMMGYKSDLTEEQIWKVVAFIMSDLNRGAEAKAVQSVAAPPAKSAPAASGSVKPAEPIAASPLVGSAQAGRNLFFDSAQQKSCGACHSFQGEGAAIGPDLSKIAGRSARELFLSIVLPHESADPRYAAMVITLRSGERIFGIKKEEDGESIRVYDTAELPAVLRTVQKSDVAKAETVSEPVMPKDYAGVYTVKQILDIVTFLKSAGAEPKSAITLKDLF